VARAAARLLEFGRDDPDAAIVQRLRDEVATRAPDLAPWLPLLAAVLDAEIAPTPEIEMLAETNRRTKLHETVARFLEAMVPDRLLIEIENVHHMDEASAELLSYLTGVLPTQRWLFAVARRPSSAGFVAPESPAVVRIELKPIALQDSVRLAQLATEQNSLPAHVLEVVAKRSGGIRSSARPVAHGDRIGRHRGPARLAEAAAMTQIDTLAPDDRALVRRAAVFGLTFHPRMLSWLYDEGDGPPPGEAALAKLGDLFDEEPDGYLRFRHSLLRDAAYEGLPYKLRRRLHGAVAAHLEEEMDFPRRPAAFCRCTTSKRANTVPRGATPRLPLSARKACMPTSRPPGCTRARWRPGAESMILLARTSPPAPGFGDRAGRFRKAADAQRPRAGRERPFADAELLAQARTSRRNWQVRASARRGSRGARRS
jgi:predicted ATPase